MFDKLWKKAVEFHGHSCPGLAYGAKAAEAVLLKMGAERAGDEELLCVTENDACGVDAIQSILGCTVGKGNLILRDRGKQVYTFFDRRSGKSLRMCVKAVRDTDNRAAWLEKLLKMDVEQVFEFSEARFDPPGKAKLFLSCACEECGEKTSENKLRIQNGKKVCLDCFEDYSRTM